MSQTTYRTTVLKSHYGWEADTHIPLEDNHILRIHTMKRYGGELVTTATRMTRSLGEFLGLSYTPTEDFHTVVTQQRVRVTERAVRAQHDQALAQVDDLKAQVKAHYADLEKEEAEMDAREDMLIA